jgi:4-amino-4-deoxy-L-arabinose transferase-like glycosyltransferase
MDPEACGTSKSATAFEVGMFAFAMLFFVGALDLWWQLDHSYPFWDGAAHVKDSMAYAQLIRHAHIFNAVWIKQFLTVNFDYPLTIHAINGTIKAIIGFNRVSDMVALLLYQFILILSIHKLSFVLLKDRLAATLAIVFVCSYPLVNILSHVPLLDLGYLAFTTLGLLGIAVFDRNPSWRTAVIMGLTLCLGATSKQIAVLFLISPCLLLLARSIKNAQWLQVGQLALAGAFPALGLLLWIVPNHTALAAWRDYYKNDPNFKAGIVSVFFDHSSQYLAGLIGMLSPWLLILAIFALFYFWKAWLWQAKRGLLKALYIPLSASLSGLILISCLALNRPEERYVIPLAITAALLSGALLSAWFNGSKLLKALASVIVFCTIAQFLLFNFTPYPILVSESIVQAVYKCAGHTSGQELVEPRPSPTPPGDKWGQEWIVSQIEEIDKGHKVTLNIIPSTPDLSVHTIDLVCIDAKTQIEPSTFRQFTLHGDIVRYDEQAIKYYQWYLIKTGYQGSTLADKASQDNYRKITAYIENPANFRLVGERDLPDKSKLKLYRHVGP